MSKVSVDRELLNSALKTIHGLAPGRFTVEEELRAAVTAQPAEAEGVVDTGSDAWMALHLLDRLSVDSSDELRVMQVEGIVKSMSAALSAVTAERDAALAENARLIEDRARFPDKPDDIGNMIRAHIGNLKAGKAQAESYARKWAAEADLLRKDAERWRYVRLQGDDTHWLNLLRVDPEDFGGNINAVVDAMIDGDTPAMAAKEA